MKRARIWIPIFGLLALAALFLKLPEIPSIFKCKTCVPGKPYLPMIGSGYFALLIALSMLFPAFPSPLIARAGLIWAALLAISLTYIDWPSICILCIIAHVCHILMWVLWRQVPRTFSLSSPFKERLFLTLLAPIAVVALFGSLNLTFMIDNLRAKQDFIEQTLQPGESVPKFSLQNDENRSFSDSDIATASKTYLNFVSPGCSHCIEQLAIINSIAEELVTGNRRFINICTSLPSNLLEQSPVIEWYLDKDEEVGDLFKISTYPTLFLIGSDGKIERVISGIPNDFKATLLASPSNF